jgi:predicted  nucleic acid-binding Zn-ribbon protein
MSERKAREFWIIEDDFGEWHVFNSPIDLGHNNLTHVREVLPGEDDELEKLRAEITKRREAAAVLMSALVDISFKSHSSLANKDTEFHNKLAREALARYDEIMKGGDV